MKQDPKTAVWRLIAVIAIVLLLAVSLFCVWRLRAPAAVPSAAVPSAAVPSAAVPSAAAPSAAPVEAPSPSPVETPLPTPTETPPPDDTRAGTDDASDFVLLSEAVPDAILELRYYSTYNFIGDRIAGYEAPVALLTREAAAALKAVSDDLLAQGYRLKIYDAYRPQTAVDQFVSWAQDASDTRMKAYFYPTLEKSEIIPQGYIAARSGHSRGSTVDLTLFDMAAGKEADMGGTFDDFSARSHYGYDGLTPEQAANRALLREVMMRHGFRPIPTEWWHFTLENEPYPDTFFTFPVRSDFGSDSP